MISYEEIKKAALDLGWDDVGITQARIPPEDIAAYQQWLADGQHADLAYMENQIRCDPEQLFPGAKSAILFISYYKQEQVPFSPDVGIVASYARGKDYHLVHRKRLKKMIAWLEQRSGQAQIAKPFSDSSPVMEKALAVQAGLGWFGKNTLLIHRRFGTFTLLSGLFTTLELPYSVLSLRLPKCGVCQRCIDACPTQALVAPYTLDAARCLSYHLIESRKEIPLEIQQKNPGYLFGCDICQDVCPHNARKPLSQTPEFHPSRGLGPTPKLSLLHPEELFGTPLQRRKLSGLHYTLDTLTRASK
jgi:epoxyqueuosine reductase